MAKQFQFKLRTVGDALSSSSKYALARYRSLPLYGKLLIWLALLIWVAMCITVIIITPSRIAQAAYDISTEIAKMPAGWLIFTGLIVVVSFPPAIGHTTTVTLCGFAYGMRGFYIAAAASVVGSAAAFVVLRLLFSERLKRWSEKNEKWQALESVIELKGLPLIVLIRMSPFPPWVYSNAFFASIDVVKLWQFAFATCFVFPKLLLHVFIGSRMASLADGDQREHMDFQTQLLDWLLVVGGAVFAIVISAVVFRQVHHHIKKLHGISPEIDELATEASEEYDEMVPLILEA
ncbi:Golgi apparatus membrane protein TVP38 [Fistulina hepatica ATCC 64428]|uniref:Golgi apparatus membrane protein TVP38 n=1 Tax=Fistulina hepatica ATCC 64428 TaxID=1128425 RepID=A0A0D7A7B6_9AGAR|nr:Golgi apparatus membrane protein TVP38 [Fistulina hepatica ATCC 64428]